MSNSSHTSYNDARWKMMELEIFLSSHPPTHWIGEGHQSMPTCGQSVFSLKVLVSCQAWWKPPTLRTPNNERKIIWKFLDHFLGMVNPYSIVWFFSSWRMDCLRHSWNPGPRRVELVWSPGGCRVLESDGLKALRPTSRVLNLSSKKMEPKAQKKSSKRDPKHPTWYSFLFSSMTTTKSYRSFSRYYKARYFQRISFLLGEKRDFGRKFWTQKNQCHGL